MAVALLVGGLSVAGISAASRLPLSFRGEHDALLRLSWRVDGVSMEECRSLTDEELANLPVHMRNPEACIGRIAPYRLQVGIDGAMVVSDTVYPAGARGDRPIFVLHDLPLDPGSTRVRVRFDPLLPPGAKPGPAAVPLFLDRVVAVEAGRIVLVTLDDAGRNLVMR
jgi:hypothetical protein